MRRRKYIALSGVVASATLAGCSRDGDRESESDDPTSATDEPTETSTPEPDPSNAETTPTDAPVVIGSVSVERISEQDLSLPQPVERTIAVVVEVEYVASGVEEFELTTALRTTETIETEATATVTANDDPPHRIELSTEDIESGSRTLVVTVQADGETDRSETVVAIEPRPLTNRERWEATYERSIKHLKKALTAYGDQAAYEGEDATIMHVLPSMDINVDDAEDELDEAKRWEGRAYDIQARLDADEFEQAQQLRRNITMTRDLAECQEHLHGVFNELDEEWEVWDDDEANARDRPEQDDLELANTLHGNIEVLVGEWGTVADGIGDKVNQIDWQLEQLETAEGGVDLMWQATVPEVTTPDQVRLAREDFESVEEELDDPGSAAPEDITDEEFLELVKTWREEAEEAERDLVS